MTLLLALLRMGVTIPIMLMGALLIAVTHPLHLRIRDARLSGWIVTCMARLFSRLFRIRVFCTGPERMRSHRGFLFANHVSFLDILVLLTVTPVRFLSTVEVQRGPVVGLLATSIGTVFVTRSDPASRRQARAEIVAALRAEAQPPLVIFPEGALGAGDRLLPFHRGAFEIAVENRIDILPCTIGYRPLEAAVWPGGSAWDLLGAVWRLARRTAPLRAELHILPELSIQGHEDAIWLAEQAHAVMAQALGFGDDQG